MVRMRHPESPYRTHDAETLLTSTKFRPCKSVVQLYSVVQLPDGSLPVPKPCYLQGWDMVRLSLCPNQLEYGSSPTDSTGYLSRLSAGLQHLLLKASASGRPALEESTGLWRFSSTLETIHCVQPTLAVTASPQSLLWVSKNCHLRVSLWCIGGDLVHPAVQFTRICHPLIEILPYRHI